MVRTTHSNAFSCYVCCIHRQIVVTTRCITTCSLVTRSSHARFTLAVVYTLHMSRLLLCTHCIGRFVVGLFHIDDMAGIDMLYKCMNLPLVLSAWCRIFDTRDTRTRDRPTDDNYVAFDALHWSLWQADSYGMQRIEPWVYHRRSNAYEFLTGVA